VSVWRSLGPGLIFAGTAIGVSHLVQSTRAGAGWGLALVWVVIAANLFKYPAFEAGPRYAAATGRSLLEGYRLRGRWALALFLAVTVSTMLTVVAAVTIVTAGMASALITDAIGVGTWCALLLAASAGLLAVGRFRLLEGFMKGMMLVLAVSTVASVVAALPATDWSRLSWGPWWPSGDPKELLFVAALVGWMPSAIDIAVWHSLWGLEKQRTEGVAYTPRRARLDFDIGYVGTAALALCFLFLGASIVHGTERELPESAAAFATLLVDLYAAALGEWARPILLVAAFATMLSTTVAVVDGFPRALEGAIARWRGPETGPGARGATYWVALAVVALGGWVLDVAFASSLRGLVDLATTLTGLTAPVLAVMNLLTLRGAEVPVEQRPAGAYLAFHLVGIAALTLMAAVYLMARLGA
jgi:Mn2+/Fe2+ NRAMP family transporter